MYILLLKYCWNPIAEIDNHFSVTLECNSLCHILFTDVKSAVQSFEKRKFKGNVITAEEVEITDGILVQGLKNDTSKEVLELYFENTRKSGGGPIRESTMYPEDNKAVVHFEEEHGMDI